MKLLPDNKKSSGLFNCIESGKIKVGSVKYIASITLVDNLIHEFGIMHSCMTDSVKDQYFSGNINLRMNLNTGLCASELCPSKDRQTQVDGSGVNGIKSSMKFKFFGDTFGLSNRHNVKSKLLKNPRVSESVNYGKYTSVDGNPSLTLWDSYFCKTII